MAGSNYIALLFLYTFVTGAAQAQSSTVQLVPALYVFGDSTVDGGNVIPPKGRYGLDLNSSIPRRWSNGLNIADYLATFLGLPLVPPYSNMTVAGSSTVGVNYGSAGCGILPQTGHEAKNGNKSCWSFDTQILFFNRTVSDNLTVLLSDELLEKHLKDSIFLVSFGINDYVFNYFAPPNGTTLGTLEPEVFAKFLLNELSFRLKFLHSLGARKFAINNIWPVGCTPHFAVNQSNGHMRCNEKMNVMLSPYNNTLSHVLMNLVATLPGFVFTSSDDFKFMWDLEGNVARYGITSILGRCLSEPYWGSVCENREHYLYFDDTHTTQAANYFFALDCFNGTLCSPRNILKLIGI